MKKSLLIIDDDPTIRLTIRAYFEREHYRVLEAATCHGAVERVRRGEPDIAIVDYQLPDGNALDLLRRWKSTRSFPVIVLTAHASIDLAVRSIKEGAENFFTKPLELEALGVVAERALENERNRRGQRVPRKSPVNPFAGTSTAIRRLEREAGKVAPAQRPILIQGETGAGKGVLAAWLYDNGPRAEEAFVDINCAGLSRELLDSELFGHEKGAFTSATTTKVGLLEAAHKGTVFLDEIGDLDLQVQPKLLKVLEEKRFRRLGSTRDRQVDIQLIAATHQDLEQMVRDGMFRSDLFFRLSMLPLRVPPLRERIEDICFLAGIFLAAIGAQLGRRNLRLAPGAKKTIETYAWPGNIRELRNVIERAALLCESDVLDAEDLQVGGRSLNRHKETRSSMSLRQVEILHISQALRSERGHVNRAADRLGIPRSTLYQKIKRYGIETDGNG